MTFCSFVFIFFAVILTVIYYIVKPAKRWIVLLAGSLVFFAICGWNYLLYAIVLSIIFFAAANAIDQINSRQSELDRNKDKEGIKQLAGKKKRILIITILLVVGNLVFNKYCNLVGHLARNIYTYFGGTGEVEWWDIALPLGLSYYTFSGLGYTLDVYWKRYASQKNYAKFLLYIIYFPHIIQGPIERYNLLGEQFFDESRILFQGKRIAQSLTLMGYGYFKKLFVADRMAILVNGVIDNPDGTPGSMQLLAILFSGIWMYADFSGYMDIANGISMVFGIQINRNFNHPILAKRISEWWCRWHMSLSSWWRDYIYMPLAISSKFSKKCSNVKKKYGKKMGEFYRYTVPLFFVWITTGLWHGTGVTYLAWGIYYSIVFTCSVTFVPLTNKMIEKLHINPNSKWFHLFQRIRTYLVFCVGRLLTVPGTLGYSWNIFKNILTNFNRTYIFQRDVFERYGTCTEEIIFMLAGIVVMIIVDCIEERNSELISVWVSKRKWFVRSALYAVFFLAIFMFGIYGVSYSTAGFAYQNF